MKRQRKYGLVARLAGLWLLVMGSVAAAKGLAGTEQQVVSILELTNSRFATNPMFRCYHLGRLQGVADRLANDVVTLSQRQTQNPEAQAQLIFSAQTLHAKLDKRLRKWAPDCDPSYTSMNSAPIANLVQFNKKRLSGIGAQDPVVGCFYAGRLQVLSDRLEKDLRKQISRGTPADRSQILLLQQSRQLILQKKSGTCEATHG